MEHLMQNNHEIATKPEPREPVTSFPSKDKTKDAIRCPTPILEDNTLEHSPFIKKHMEETTTHL
jgi:hypothetical protein